MATVKHDLVIANGEDFNFTLRITDAFDDPAPFTLASCKAQIREEHKKPLIAAFTLTNLGDGTLKFALPSATTKLLPVAASLKWDFFFADSNGLLSKLLYGRVIVEPNITDV